MKASTPTIDNKASPTLPSSPGVGKRRSSSGGRSRSPSTGPGFELRELWRRYTKDGNDTDRERLVLNFAPLTKFVAGRLRAKLPSHVEEDDLISWGLTGLLGAIKRYDPERGVKFETFAMIRIRGAMLDELRSLDWVPRKVRQEAHETERAESSFIAEQQRPPTEPELAERLEISEDALQRRLLEIASSAIYSFDAPLTAGSLDGSGDTATLLDTVASPGFADPQKALDDDESAQALKTNLTDAISCLPERQRFILALYYREELQMREIGEVLDITESRVSQLHAQALISLRATIAPDGAGYSPFR
jgi:RNA polymerase sigma factor FliA